MLDYLDIPKSQNGYIDTFTGNSTADTWQVWNKPRGISMIQITCIGGGGGGAGGYCRNTSSTRSGGAGGGSGGFSRLSIPAIFLPDIFYISVGRGGAGGDRSFIDLSGNGGTSGTASYVSIAPSTGAIYVICAANAGGGGGTPGSTSSAAGSAAAIQSKSSALMSALGSLFVIAGQAGGAGSNGSWTDLTYPITGLLLSGGGPGAGSTGTRGGNITAPTQSSFTLFSTVLGGTSGSTGLVGQSGIELYQPLLSTGGAGGGGGNSITLGANTSGSSGGAGGFGSGGGGGGTGQLVGGSGAGGKGGNGLVIINSW